MSAIVNNWLTTNGALHLVTGPFLTLFLNSWSLTSPTMSFAVWPTSVSLYAPFPVIQLLGATSLPHIATVARQMMISWMRNMPSFCRKYPLFLRTGSDNVYVLQSRTTVAVNSVNFCFFQELNGEAGEVYCSVWEPFSFVSNSRVSDHKLAELVTASGRVSDPKLRRWATAGVIGWLGYLLETFKMLITQRLTTRITGNMVDRT